MSQENNQNKEGNSKTLDLENLNTNYKNLLIEYKLAVSNYIDYLNKSFDEPCNSFTKDSKNIDKKDKFRIDKRTGEDLRCQRYCSSNKFCKYYQETYMK